MVRPCSFARGRSVIAPMSRRTERSLRSRRHCLMRSFTPTGAVNGWRKPSPSRRAGSTACAVDGRRVPQTLGIYRQKGLARKQRIHRSPSTQPASAAEPESNCRAQRNDRRISSYLIHGVQPEGLALCYCVATTFQGRSTVSSGPSEPLLREPRTLDGVRLDTYVPQARVDVGTTTPSGVDLACAHCRASWATSGPNPRGADESDRTARVALAHPTARSSTALSRGRLIGIPAPAVLGAAATRRRGREKSGAHQPFAFMEAV